MQVRERIQIYSTQESPTNYSQEEKTTELVESLQIKLKEME